jgi:TolB protein
MKMTSRASTIAFALLALSACGGDAASTGRDAKAAETAPPRDTMPMAERRAIGGRIYFVSERGGGADVYAIRPSGDGLARLTTSEGDDFPAAVAADGRVAVVTVRPGEDAVEAIEIRSGDGRGGARAVVPASARARSPSWSPDGRWLAFEGDRESFRDIYRVAADGRGLTRLTHDREGNFEPAVSPDGRWIAFASSRDGNAELYLMRADGTGQRRLTAFHRDDWGPRWSPDGRWIAFLSNREGRDRILLVRPDGTGLRRLTPDSASSDTQEADPAWSPDGSSIAHTRLTSEGISIRVTPVGTGAARDVGAGLGPVRQPAWSPDGGHLAFVAGAQGQEDVWIARADGSGATRLTRAPGADWLPRWGRK